MLDDAELKFQEELRMQRQIVAERVQRASHGSKGVSWIPHKPTTRQKLFLDLDCKEAFYGGAAAGGKSDALLMAALQYVNRPGYAALLLRRTYADLSKPGALMDRLHSWGLKDNGATWNEQKKQWKFPSGAILQFGYLDTENDVYQYQSSEFQFCVAPGTLVLMADGTKKPIEKIRTGESVITLEGPRSVTRTHPVRKAKRVRVEVYDSSGRWIGTQFQSDTHPVLTPHGWLAYRDMCDASRPFAISLSTQNRSSRRFVLLPSPQFPFPSRMSLRQGLDLEQRFSRVRSHEDQKDREAFSALIIGGRNDFVAFDGSLQESRRLPWLTFPVVLHGHRLQKGRPFLQSLNQEREFSCVRSLSLLVDSQDDYPFLCGLCDGRLNHQVGGSPDVLPLSFDAAAQNDGIGSEYNKLPLLCGHCRKVLYDHPYEKDKRRSIASVSVGSIRLTPCGYGTFYDLTVSGASHYITTTGLVNRNCGFDELTQFTERQYTYLFSRLRRLAESDIPLRMRSASNPGGVGAEWVEQRFIPENWVGEMSRDLKVWDLSDGRKFVPARIDDNPHVDQESYRESLAELDEVTKAQLEEGNWSIRPRGNIYKSWSDGIDGQHVITWTQFEKVYGARRIPSHWRGAVGQDWGFDPDPCATVWNWVAAENGPLAGSIFVDKILTCRGEIPDSVGEKIKLAEDGQSAQIDKRVMSHEASSQRETYRVKCGLNFHKWKPDAHGGIAQMQHYLTIIDQEKPHPFKPHLSGRPRYFVIVPDDQLVNPKEDEGLALLRAEFAGYKYVEQRVTTGRGTNKIVPYDFFNHYMDAQRGIAGEWFAPIAPKTYEEKIKDAIPEPYRYENMVDSSPTGEITPEQEMAHVFQRMRAVKTIKPRQKQYDEYGRLIR